MTRTGQGHDNLMGHRVISGLFFAAPCERPSNIPSARLRGTKRLGMKYEKDFAKALQSKFPKATIASQWFRFADVNGRGYCQTDLLLKFDSEVIIFECKLTDTERAKSQLSKLYFPVVKKAFARPVKGIIVTRHLSQTTELGSVVDQLGVAMAAPQGHIPIFHWRERNPL